MSAWATHWKNNNKRTNQFDENWAKIYLVSTRQYLRSKRHSAEYMDTETRWIKIILKSLQNSGALPMWPRTRDMLLKDICTISRRRALLRKDCPKYNFAVYFRGESHVLCSRGGLCDNWSMRLHNTWTCNYDWQNAVPQQLTDKEGDENTGAFFSTICSEYLRLKHDCDPKSRFMQTIGTSEALLPQQCRGSRRLEMAWGHRRQP